MVRAGGLVRAEWTKLRSVRRWLVGLAVAVLVTVGISTMAASGTVSDLNSHPEALGVAGPGGNRVKDEAHLVYQPLTGDGGIVAMVASQDSASGWAVAGVMLRRSADPGSEYAATYVTPGHGVRFQANYGSSRAGGSSRWVRLARTGDTVTGYESSDGAAWQRVGAVTLRGLPATVLVGLVVTSPPVVHTERSLGGSLSGAHPTQVSATFDRVRVEPAAPEAPWQELDTSAGPDRVPYTTSGSVFTLVGSGELAVRPIDADVPQLGLIGVFLGQIAVIVIAVLFVTTEFQRGVIRTTLTAVPQRGGMLVAKAAMIGAVTFVTGLIAAVAAFLVTQPILRGHGFVPPGYPTVSLWDGPVLRAMVGVAVLMALVAVLSMSVGVIVRRGAVAVAGLIVLVVAPVFVVTALPLSAARWVVRLTPTAGLSLTQTIAPGPDGGGEPWTLASPGIALGVLCAYAALALAGAYWMLRRRDA